MNVVLQSIRRTPILLLLIFVPILFIAERTLDGAETTLFIISVLAMVPLAGLLSLATESVAERTGDAWAASPSFWSGSSVV